MSRDQRTQDNWALLYAIQTADKLRQPLIVTFALAPDPGVTATLRQTAFAVKGLREGECGEWNLQCATNQK